MAVAQREIHQCDLNGCKQQFELENGYLISLTSYSGLRTWATLLPGNSGSIELCKKHFNEVVNFLGLYR